MTLSLLTSGYDYNLIEQINRCRVALGLTEVGSGASLNLFDQINQLRYVLGLPLVGTGASSDLIKEINDLITPINEFGGGGGSYHADAVHIDVNTYATLDSLLSANNGLISYVWFFKSIEDGGLILLSDPDDESLMVGFGNSPGTEQFLASSADFASNFQFHSTSTYNDGQWHSIIGSVNTNFAAGSRKAKMYIDNVDTSYDVAENGSSFVIPFNGKPFWLFNTSNPDEKYIGDICNLWIAPDVSLLDGTFDIPLATRRLFVDADNKPVDPSGYPPGGMTFTGDATAWTTQAGLLGFDILGALTNASTSPSD